MSRYLFSRKAARATVAGLPRDQRQFYEQLGAESDVLLEPGYNQDEFFDDQFERRAREKTRTPAASNALTLIPAMQGPWTGNNNLGAERPFSPNAENRQTVLKLPEWGFPEAWSLCLGLTYDVRLFDASSSYFGVTAEIEFGVGGVMQQVEIDWLQGTVIVLPMNAVNVIASFSSAPNEGGLASPLPEDLRLRANIVHGSLPGSNPTRSFLVEGLDPVIPIPPFAKSVRVTPTASPFGFYVDPAEFVLFTSAPVGLNPATLMTMPRSQFVRYINVVDQTLGCPEYIDIIDGARFMQLTGLMPAPINVQFRIGV